MEEVQARHRKELRDLQSRITQKKKQASKKTRKGVNDECDKLEAELKERQQLEITALDGEGGARDAVAEEEELSNQQLAELTLKVDDDADGLEEQAKTNGDAAHEPPSTDAQQPTTAGKKRNRQKDRLARRAAEQEDLARQAEEEAKNLPDLKQQERTRMLEAMKSHRLAEKEIRADGHCLYSAVADQLQQLGIPLDEGEGDRDDSSLAYRTVRAKAADYIADHRDDFVPFLEEPLQEYLRKVRDTGEWGGQLELMALAKTYGTDINVLQDFGRVERIEAGSDEEGEEKKEIWLGYYKHGFGLGEHYNSLRKVP